MEIYLFVNKHIGLYIYLFTILNTRGITMSSLTCLVPDHLFVLLPDAFLVLVSEYMVDWGKHAFILKFNEIQADVSFYNYF